MLGSQRSKPRPLSLGRHAMAGRVRRRMKTVLFSLLGAALLGGAVYLVWFSSAFKIESIEVEGAVLTDTNAIRDDAGENILFWEPPESLLTSVPVSNIEVDKDFVDRRIIVRIEERPKALIWCLEAKGECYWADEAGFVFNVAPKTEGSLVVKVIRDYTERDVKIGETVLPENYFQNLTKIFELLDTLRVPIDEVRIDNLKFREVTAQVSNGPALYFSLEIDPKFAGSVIESLRTSSQWSQIRYVDLRVENRAFYSL